MYVVAAGYTRLQCVNRHAIRYLCHVCIVKQDNPVCFLLWLGVSLYTWGSACTNVDMSIERVPGTHDSSECTFHHIGVLQRCLKVREQLSLLGEKINAKEDCIAW